MVAIIKTSNSIRRSFYYNESKVKQGLAECIGAGHYPCSPGELSEKQRLNMLLRLAALNENVQRNSVHISLNFHPDDVLSKKQLCEIARHYMNSIGFEHQPFLIYQHKDAAHPHLHLVSVVVRADGSRIATHNNAKDLSELARMHLEQQYGLVAARLPTREQLIPAVSARRVIYGKAATKRSISQVLDVVVPNFKYSSLQELNAVLGQYNIVVEAQSRQGGSGLLYRITDEHGRRLGVPINASDLDSKPTLINLSKRFEQNKEAKFRALARMRSTVQLAMLKTRSMNSPAFLSGELKKDGINMVLKKSRQGLITEIFYVDFGSRCVFSQQDLAQKHSARIAIDNYDQHSGANKVPPLNQQAGKESGPGFVQDGQTAGPYWIDTADKHSLLDPTSRLFEPVPANNYTPWQLRKSRKKKQKKMLHHL
ncbi:relaxase/mobilization nuclease domain-containing protein [Dyadobacter psychrophilus]|uniref:Relaxase/Mobilisation nuclease domain-containing protein n=1 Tax=Dyadobacter psychrophilus TaxID=651661 RepID=A0A1T5HDP5_9BACT|nr:relaxase/mobilization nuclease domain-containing protein [Dyadobacter psychrophilus]SKC18709.1 Relaxase/Mobilisation nuclease domain-containing protein [Dyadobacter psychrophilus]